MTKEDIGQNVKKISCSGYDNLSKHPLIYLDIKNKKQAICPYCGKIFLNKNIK